MPKRALAPNLAEDLAEALVRAAAGQRQAGRVLHDDIGPLLAAAGLRLNLLRMDFPDTADRVREVMEALDDAMEHTRALSRRLNPSPVGRVGFQDALSAMVESHRQSFPGKVLLRFRAPARLPFEAAVAMYEAADAVLSAAVKDSRTPRIDVSVLGSGTVTLKVKYNHSRSSHGGRGNRELAMAALLARGSGLEFEVTTEKGTIVWIKYALRRPSRG